MQTRLFLRLVMMVVVATVVAGCGGPDRAEYETDLAKVGRSVDTALAALPQDSSTPIGAEEVAALADQLSEAADQLEDLDPPKDAEAAQRQLERGLRGVAEAFESLATKLQDAQTDEDKAELFVAFATDDKIDRAFDDLAASQESFAREGYRVFRVPAPANADE